MALADGTEFHAPIVVSALDPRRTFLELVEPRELPTDLVDTIERFRFQGTSAKVNFALDGVPRYPALGDRTDQYRGFTNIGPSMEYLERAYDDAKYGWYSKKPYLDCAIQSMVDPDMAPPGKAVMSCFVQYAPYHLRGSDWDTEKEGLGDTVQATLESFFPGFGDLVLQREIRTPLDIERTVGLSEGNIFAGEFLAPQMYFFRPAPGWSQYATPIDGYYQCGSGTHPGGCVMGAPGKLAAQRILKDRAASRPRSSVAPAADACSGRRSARPGAVLQMVPSKRNDLGRGGAAVVPVVGRPDGFVFSKRSDKRPWRGRLAPRTGRGRSEATIRTSVAIPVSRGQPLAGLDPDRQPVLGRRQRTREPDVVDARRVVGQVEVEGVGAVVLRFEIEVATGAVRLVAARRVEEGHEQPRELLAGSLGGLSGPSGGLGRMHVL